MNTADGYRSPATTSTLAVVSLVCGIATWVVLPFIGAIVAVVCGHLARSEIRRAPPGALEGDGLAVAGLVLGYLHLVFGAIALTVLLGLMVGVLHWAH